MLTKREEIASRLLAGVMANPETQGMPTAALVGWALQATDELIAKLAETEPQPEPVSRPSWDDAPIHELLMDWRLFLHLKQSDVSDATGVAPSQISQWESGRCLPNAKNFVKLAIFYAGSVDVFLRGEPRKIAKAGE